MTNKEYRNIYLGFKSDFKWNCDISTNKTKLSTVPESIDWREKGFVTPVKDQGKCGLVDKIYEICQSLIKRIKNI